MAYPVSQSELIRAARAARTKTEFARVLGVDRTCLGRYESEELGAPTKVLNYCLRAIASREPATADAIATVEEALTLAKQTVGLLERAAKE